MLLGQWQQCDVLLWLEDRAGRFATHVSILTTGAQVSLRGSMGAVGAVLSRAVGGHYVGRVGRYVVCTCM